MSELAKLAVAGSGSTWVGVIAFVVGSALGVGGVLLWQAASRSPEVVRASPPPVEEPDESPPVPTPPVVTPVAVAVAPMPHEPRPPEPEVAPEPRAAHVPPPPSRITVITLNEPGLAYTIPLPTKKGEHVIVKGRVKSLRVSGLDHGALVDASELQAEIVSIGRIAGNSVVKVNAPNGAVQITGVTEGKSVVEINAPGGDVKFALPTVGTRLGSRICGDSVVTVTARLIDFRGEIIGDGTRVSVNLERSGSLKVASVSGKAVVEYRTPVARSAPDVTVGPVAPTAVFRKVE